MAVTATQVKELRDRTNAGIMDCKKVLVETDGNIEKAIELLRERGIAKAAKKAGIISLSSNDYGKGKNLYSGRDAV